MAKKTIVIIDSSTFRNSSSETVRLESTFGAFRNNHLAKFFDKLDWIVVGNRDILSAAPHKFYSFAITKEDIEIASVKGVSAGMVSATKIKERITSKLGVTPDLIIFSSDNHKDWDEYDILVNGLGSSEQSTIRNSVLMINTACCRYDIIVPQIIGMLKLETK